MTTRRSRGDGALFWDEPRQRWIATVTVGFDGRGKRIARKASGRTKTEAKDKLKALMKAAQEGRPAPDARLTVKDVVTDWLEFGLSDRDPATKTKQKIIAETHVIPHLGARRLAELTTPEVDRWLMERSKNLGSDMLRRIHSCLNRSVKRAVARDLVARNVVSLMNALFSSDGARSETDRHPVRHPDASTRGSEALDGGYSPSSLRVGLTGLEPVTSALSGPI